MAKRVKLGIEGLRVNETECRLLCTIIERSRRERGVGCEYVAMSRRDMATALGCSPLTTVRSCQALEEAGLMEAHPEHMDNGAQVASSYRATALGLEVARLYALTLEP